MPDLRYEKIQALIVDDFDNFRVMLFNMLQELWVPKIDVAASDKEALRFYWFTFKFITSTYCATKIKLTASTSSFDDRANTGLCGTNNTDYPCTIFSFSSIGRRR